MVMPEAPVRRLAMIAPMEWSSRHSAMIQYSIVIRLPCQTDTFSSFPQAKEQCETMTLLQLFRMRQSSLFLGWLQSQPISFCRNLM